MGRGTHTDPIGQQNTLLRLRWLCPNVISLSTVSQDVADAEKTNFAHLASLPYPECLLTEAMTTHGFLFRVFSLPSWDKVWLFVMNGHLSSRWPCFNRQRCVCSVGCMGWIWSKACHAHNHISPRREHGVRGVQDQGLFHKSFFLLCGWSFGCWGFDFLNNPPHTHTHRYPILHPLSAWRWALVTQHQTEANLHSKEMSLSINTTWQKKQLTNSPKDKPRKHPISTSRDTPPASYLWIVRASGKEGTFPLFPHNTENYVQSFDIIVKKTTCNSLFNIYGYFRS